MAVETPSPPEDMSLKDIYQKKADDWAHALLQFIMTTRNIFSPEIDLSKPADIKRFINTLGSQNGQLSSISHLVTGDFANIGAFASLIYNKYESRQSQELNARQQTNNTDPEQSHEAQKEFSYADVLKSRLPQPTAPKTSRLPPLTTVPATATNDFNEETISLTKKAILRFERTALSTIGHEQKKFALLRTSPEQPPMQNPFNITRCMAEAGIREPLTLVKTGDSRTFLVFAPESCLPLLQPAYERFHRITVRHCGVKRLPKIIVEPIADLLSLCSNDNFNADLEQLVLRLRDEIFRLEQPSTFWRPRLHFADALRRKEDECFNELKKRQLSLALNPLQARSALPNNANADPRTDAANANALPQSRVPEEEVPMDCPMSSETNTTPPAPFHSNSRSPALRRPTTSTNRFHVLQNEPNTITAATNNVVPSAN